MLHHPAAAQYSDTVVEPPIVEDSSFQSVEYGDSDEEKHIYDSSEYFFEWKSFAEQRFRYDSFARRNIPDSVIQQFEKDDDFWYVNEAEDFRKLYLRFQSDPAFRDSLMKAKGFKENDKKVTVFESGARPGWVDTVIWILVMLIVTGAVIYFLSANKISLFSKNDKRIMDENGEGEEEDLFNMKYPELIRKAVAEKNFRLAVRLHYLQTLTMLDEKKLIRYIPENTNQHYLMQLHGTKYFNEFATVTRDYEYVWYGNFALAETGYERVREDFINLQNKVKYA